MFDFAINLFNITLYDWEVPFLANVIVPEHLEEKVVPAEAVF